MPDMTQRVNDAMRRLRMSDDPYVRYLDAVSELGELGKEILKAGDYGATKPIPGNAMLDEAGDSLFSMLCLFHALGINAERALESAMQKYEERFSQKGRISSE